MLILKQILILRNRNFNFEALKYGFFDNEIVTFRNRNFDFEILEF